jgi:hypothetical protein
VPVPRLPHSDLCPCAFVRDHLLLPLPLQLSNETQGTQGTQGTTTGTTGAQAAQGGQATAGRGEGGLLHRPMPVIVHGGMKGWPALTHR